MFYNRFMSNLSTLHIGNINISVLDSVPIVGSYFIHILHKMGADYWDINVKHLALILLYRQKNEVL